MKLDECVAYAKRHNSPGWIMQAPDGQYHFIISMYDHWITKYKLIARVAVEIQVHWSTTCG